MRIKLLPIFIFQHWPSLALSLCVRLAENPALLAAEVGRLMSEPRHTHLTLPTGRVVPREVVLPQQFTQLLSSEIPARYLLS